MFQSTTLMAAIHADRQREIERIGRDRRLLFQPSDVVDVGPQASVTTVATPTKWPGRAAPSSGAAMGPGVIRVASPGG